MNSSPPLPAADYEPRDAPPGRLLLVGGGLGVGILGCLTLSLAIYLGRYHGAPRVGAPGRQTSFHDSPHAQTDIAADWARLDAEVRQHLETYGRIDRDAGLVHIPIEVAMHRLADEAARKGKSP